MTVRQENSGGRCWLNSAGTESNRETQELQVLGVRC